MVNCEYCDYYKSINENEAKKKNIKAICEFTDAIIYTGDIKSGKEYPCKNVTYQEYLNKKNRQVV